MQATATRYTFTHPRTGQTWTRTSDNDYTHVSIVNGQIQWHQSDGPAYQRAGRSGDVFRVEEGQPPGSTTPSGLRKRPNPRSFNSMWDHLYDHHGARIPNSAQDLDALRAVHDAEHAERDNSPYGGLKHVHGSLRVAKDQTVVPEKVDTMREEICPVCGSDDSYVGDKCTVCGFEKPPSIFMDPDTSLAQNVDLRQEDQEQANDDGAGDLQCPNCGETFSSAESLNQAGDPHLAPAAQTIPAEEDLEAPEEGDEIPPGEQVPADEAEPPGPEEDMEDEEAEENQMAPGPPVGASEAPEDQDQPEPPEPGEEEEEPPEGALPAPDEQEEPEPVPSGEEPAPGEEPDEQEAADAEEVPEGAEEGMAEGEASPEEMAEEQYATDQAAMAQTGYEEGDICPNCGQGLLQDIGINESVPSPGNPPEISEDMPQGAPPITPERADTEPDADAGEEADEVAAAEEEGAEPESEEEAEEEDNGDQEPEGDEEEPEDDEEEEDGDQPPWLKKKTSSSYELPMGRRPSTMPNRPRPGRTTPRQATQAPAASAEPTPRSSVRTALHASLNTQAAVLRRMTAACQQERLLRLAAEARIETLERQMLRFAQIAGADTDNELRHINEEGYQRHASLMARAASLHTADARDPAQPVPEGAPEPPVVTEQQAAQPAGRDDVTNLGATPVTDVSADATVAVDQPYGTEAFEPLNLNEVDVTAPVANTQGHLPPEQTIIPVEVRVGDPDDPQPSFGWTLDGAGAPQGQTGGSVGSGAPVSGGGAPGVQPGTRASRQPRQDGQVSLGALRLARLRIQAGIAPPGQDDIAIAASIQDNPDMTVEAVNTEIKTLTQVLSVPQQQARVATANRRLVPRPANPVSEAPSLAVSEPGPIRAHASTGAVTADEMLFE